MLIWVCEGPSSQTLDRQSNLSRFGHILCVCLRMRNDTVTVIQNDINNVNRSSSTILYNKISSLMQTFCWMHRNSEFDVLLNFILLNYCFSQRMLVYFVVGRSDFQIKVEQNHKSSFVLWKWFKLLEATMMKYKEKYTETKANKLNSEQWN